MSRWSLYQGIKPISCIIPSPNHFPVIMPPHSPQSICRITSPRVAIGSSNLGRYNNLRPCLTLDLKIPWLQALKTSIPVGKTSAGNEVEVKPFLVDPRVFFFILCRNHLFSFFFVYICNLNICKCTACSIMFSPSIASSLKQQLKDCQSFSLFCMYY